MKFIDASVFVYAYLKPRRPIAVEVVLMKRNAQKIIARVNQGEEALTSLVHVSEVANILEGSLPILQSCEILESLVSLDNVKVTEPTLMHYLGAIDFSKDSNLGVNDALAILLMKEEGVSEIYSFDKDFDSLKGITRLSE